jgi:hypothetical protein
MHSALELAMGLPRRSSSFAFFTPAEVRSSFMMPLSKLAERASQKNDE